MTARRCHRLWQAEAVRDGRLSVQDAGSFAVHVRDCRVCSAEVQRLQRLAGQLRELVPAADEVSVFRGRQHLLEALDQRAQRAQAAGSRMQSVWAACAGLALTLAVGALGMHARFTRARVGSVESVELSGEGIFDIHIKRKPHDPRVTVLLPDGYIDDVGTAFQVYLQARGTIRIAVSEGAIDVHWRDGTDMHLTAGQAWSAAALVAPNKAKPGQAAVPPGERPARAETHPSTLSPTRQAPPLSAAPVELEVPRTQPQHPRPSLKAADTAATLNTEDAAYMRVVSLLREGRDFEAQLAALDYLKRYPTGFRHLEIARILNLEDTHAHVAKPAQHVR
jgi:TolA-binding protein